MLRHARSPENFQMQIICKIFLVYKPLQETNFSLVSNFSIYKEETFKRNEFSGFIKFHSSSPRTIICVLYLFLKNKKYYGNGNLLQTFN